MNRIRLDELVPDPKNRRTHPERNRQMIRDSLADVGPARSIVIDETNTVLAGNGVLEAAQELGLSVRIIEPGPDELIAVRKSGLDEAQKRRLAIYDNRTAELAEWDVEQLRADRDGGLELAPFFSEVELARELGIVLASGRTAPDAAPATRPTTIVRGECFALGRHRLLCGDCTELADVARLFGEERAAMCFTSPPYAQQRTYTGAAADLSPAHLARFLAVAEARCDLFAVNLGLVRRENRIDRYWDAYIAAAEEAGLALLSWNVWSREGQSMSVGQATAMFPIQHEWIFVFGHERRALIPTIANKQPGLLTAVTDREADGTLTRKRPPLIREKRELGTVITLPAVTSNADHPAKFPVALPIAYLASVVGDVYEPFAGSGTTIIAAEQLDRRCFAIEIAPEYCQVAIDRWEAFTGKTADRLS